MVAVTNADWPSAEEGQMGLRVPSRDEVLHPERVANASDEAFVDHLLQHDDIRRDVPQNLEDQFRPPYAAVEYVIGRHPE